MMELIVTIVMGLVALAPFLIIAFCEYLDYLERKRKGEGK